MPKESDTGTVWVRMRTSGAGAMGTWDAGDEVEFEKSVGEAIVSGEYGTLIPPPTRVPLPEKPTPFRRVRPARGGKGQNRRPAGGKAGGRQQSRRGDSAHPGGGATGRPPAPPPPGA